MYPGVDIIEIERFRQAVERHPRIMQRLFTERELAALKDARMESLAVRFAGKEAVLKALGTGLSGLSWHDVEILQEANGEPVVYLSERAIKQGLKRGVSRAQISLSHNRTQAIAMAILI